MLEITRRTTVLAKRWCYCWLTTALCLATIVCGQINSIGGAISPSAGSHRRDEQALRHAKSKEMLKYMNLTINPCSDFYEFACGNWDKFNPPVKCSVKTTQSQLELRVNKDLQVLLEEAYTLQDSLTLRKVKDFYASCLSAESRSAKQKTFFLNFAKKHGGIPAVPETNWHHQYNWVKVLASLRSNFGLDILIGLDIDTNLQTMRGHSIYFTEPTSTLLPQELCSAETMSQMDIREEPYVLIQKQVAENLLSWFSIRSSEALRIAGDVVSFEFNLCKKLRQGELITTGPEPTGDADLANQLGAQLHGVPYRIGQGRLNNNNNRQGNVGQYARQSLQQFTQQFGGLIDFKQYVDDSFETSFNDQVYMRDEAYFTHLAHLLKTTTKPTLANYIMYRALSTLSFPLDDRANKRPKYCVELVLRFFPKNIGDLYSRKNQRSDSIADVESVYQQISKAFDDSLTVEWMEEKIRRAAKQKITQFKVRFPQYQNLNLNDLKIERLDYWHKLEHVMKYNAKEQLSRLYSTDYNRKPAEALESPDVDTRLQYSDNELLMGWGLLQPPFFHHLYPNSLKYAMLGQRLARELTYAFDEQGWNRNPLSPMHWDEYTAEGFRNRSQCFRAQYSNYLHNNPEIFRNGTKLRQLIADSSGLNVAFRAYLGWLNYIDPSNRATLSKETLPDVNFTNTQLFFINFAQTRCAAIFNKQPTPEFLPMDKHTPERYDVNGPLSNFDEFSREFNCAAGTPMNPDDKCVIY